MSVRGLLVVLLVASLGACREGASQGVLVRFLLSGSAPRPDHLLVSWAVGARFSHDIRIPREGALPSSGRELATLFVEIPLGDPNERRIVARGLRGAEEVVYGTAAFYRGRESRQEVAVELAESSRPADRGAADAAIADATVADAGAQVDVPPPAPDRPVADQAVVVDLDRLDRPSPDLAAPPDARASPDGGVEIIDFAALLAAGRLRLNGSARVDQTALVLTDASKYLLASAFLLPAIDLEPTTRLEFAFRARISGADPSYGTGDGMAFVLQNAPAGAGTRGGGGGGIGYEGIAPSIVVELDTFKNPFDPNGNHIALTRDGKPATPLDVEDSPGFALNGPEGVYVWVVVEPNGVQVYASASPTRPAAPMVDAVLDVRQALAGRAFVGFTSSTGEALSRHEVLSLSIRRGP